MELFSSYIRELEKNMEKARANWSCAHADAFYVLQKANSNIVKDYIETSKNKDFWDQDWLFEDKHILWYLSKLGCQNHELFEEAYGDMKKSQTIEGSIHSNNFFHSGPLRVLTLLEPSSQITKNAIQYFIDNWKEDQYERIEFIAIGVLALAESNFFYYQDLIKEIVDDLKKNQHKAGYFGKIRKYGAMTHYPIEETLLAICALSRIDVSDRKKLQKGFEWCIKTIEKHENRYKFRYLPLIIESMIALGHGPQISFDQLEWERMLAQQRVEYSKPTFIHTSPIYQSRIHVKELYNQTRQAIKRAKSSIRISSLYIDTLYEEIINRMDENQNLEIKILTRPAKDIKGTRERIAKNVLQLLNTASKGGLKTNFSVHSRMIIIDDKEMIVSSSDLTRDQLFDEFNAGVFITDPKCISDAVAYFENAWGQSDQLEG